MISNAIWLAGIFGPYLALIGLWMLLYSDVFHKVNASVKATPGLFYLCGMMSLLIGLTILSQYHAWNWNLAILMTLYGWFLLIRGFLVLFIPQAILKSSSKKGGMKLMGVVPLVVGLLLCWLAFSS